MKIVVVSDTHMPRMAKRLPGRLVRELESAGFILHAGDWTSEDVYGMLAKYAPVEGVAGNNDGEQMVKRLGYRKIVTCGQAKIGLIHGHGPNLRISAEQRAAKEFAPSEADIVVFGHSHIPVRKRIGQMLLFNPGSPTDKRRQKQFSFGILEVEGGDIRSRHVFYDSKE